MAPAVHTLDHPPLAESDLQSRIETCVDTLDSLRPPVLTFDSRLLRGILGPLHPDDLVELPDPRPCVPLPVLPLKQPGCSVNVVVPPQPVPSRNVRGVIDVGLVPLPSVELQQRLLDVHGLNHSQIIVILPFKRQEQLPVDLVMPYLIHVTVLLEAHPPKEVGHLVDVPLPYIRRIPVLLPEHARLAPHTVPGNGVPIVIFSRDGIITVLEEGADQDPHEFLGLHGPERELDSKGRQILSEDDFAIVGV
mmetsp:Transcript_22739/g.42743  ORF Transcript_22739/g.42743 Transcript_22739/m.42743 type:complete len:249 (-) Transcript_22739:649-1395(-)